MPLRPPSGPLALNLLKVIPLSIDERRPMIEEQDDAEDSPRHYVPSGRVNLASLVPILAASAWVALGMAFVLLFAERRLYLPFLTPMLLGLPVFGVIGLSVRWGQCRNRGMGGLIGVFLVFVYYAGYWELSYLTNVVRAARAWSRRAAGSAGSRACRGTSFTGVSIQGRSISAAAGRTAGRRASGAPSSVRS